jgi:hypothetical protein
MPPPQRDDDDPFYAIVESIMRISLAGFGGALAGMSLSRRGAVVSAAAAKVVVKSDTVGLRNSGKKRLQSQQTIVRTTPPTAGIVDRDLPTAWAVACGVFAGVVEFTRTMSPTTIIRQLVDVTMIDDAGVDDTGKNLDNPTTIITIGDTGADDTGKNSDNQTTITTMMGISTWTIDSTSMTTVSDYSIGGAIAGAIFQGSAIQTRARRGIDLTAIRGKPLSGILPGAALGLSAGILIVAIDYAQILLEEKFGTAEYNDEVALDGYPSAALEKSGNATMIPADIKAMSNEELMKSIEKLKKGDSEESLSTQLSSSSEDSSRSRSPMWRRIIFFWRRE